ncbi:MAG: hypothetical protein O7A98_10455 [Acidobacteria bacterium]|nr:hypothetical protein [Acidobacteriota bacterium]MCZ6727755.1 hypothetical protein [Acidobacteriota bacterium]
MFRLIAVIAIIMMPIVSVVSTGSSGDPFQSRDIFSEEGCRPTCDPLMDDPFTKGGTNVNSNR